MRGRRARHNFQAALDYDANVTVLKMLKGRPHLAVDAFTVAKRCLMSMLQVGTLYGLVAHDEHDGEETCQYHIVCHAAAYAPYNHHSSELMDDHHIYLLLSLQ